MKISVLIVEDEPTYAFHLEMLVDQLDFECQAIVDNAEDALQQIAANLPDLILMDINLVGDMDGIELAKTINKRRQIPIIFITSFRDDETFKRAKLTFPAAFILKPFDALQLQRTIETAVLEIKPDDPLLLKDAFFVRQGTNLVKVRISDISYVEVEERYCSIISESGRKAVIRISLSELMKKLPPQFQQSHRSYALNIEKVEAINLSDMTVDVAGIQVPLSKNYKEALLSSLDSL